VSEKRVLRKIFGPKRDEVEWEWRQLHNVEHCDFTPRQIHIICIIVVMKSRKNRRNMQHKWERGEIYTEFWWGNLKGRVSLENLYVDRRIILKCVFKK
jgi:hypothetical protein